LIFLVDSLKTKIREKIKNIYFMLNFICPPACPKTVPGATCCVITGCSMNIANSSLKPQSL